MGTLNNGVWRYVAGQRSGTTLSTWIDGIQDGSTTIAAGYDLSLTSQKNAYIGIGITQSGLWRSEEHTSELQSHSFISYAVFCLKKKT